MLFYNAMRFGTPCKDPGEDLYERRYRERVVKQLRRRAADVRERLEQEASDMPFNFHALQEVPLPWRQRQPKRALILTSSAELAALLQTLLGGNGWATFVQQDASNWVQLVHRPRPSVVVCDLDTTDGAALHLAHEIRQDPSFQHASLIAVSACSEPHVVRAATVAGFNYG